MSPPASPSCYCYFPSLPLHIPLSFYPHRHGPCLETVIFHSFPDISSPILVLSDQGPPSLRAPILGMRPAPKHFCQQTSFCKSSRTQINQEKLFIDAIFRSTLPWLAADKRSCLVCTRMMCAKSLGLFFAFPWQMGPEGPARQVSHPSSYIPSRSMIAQHKRSYNKTVFEGQSKQWSGNCQLPHDPTSMGCLCCEISFG